MKTGSNELYKYLTEFEHPGTRGVIMAEPSATDMTVVFSKDHINSNISFYSGNVISRSLSLISVYERRENLLITAIRNQIRRLNFVELYHELENGEISDEDFEQKIQKEDFRFVITISNDINNDEINHIHDLMDRIGGDLRDFGTRDVSELFSVNEGLLMSPRKRI